MFEGLSHLASTRGFMPHGYCFLWIWNIWHADYWAEAGMKAVTTAAFVMTAIKALPMLKRITWKDRGS